MRKRNEQIARAMAEMVKDMTGHENCFQVQAEDRLEPRLRVPVSLRVGTKRVAVELVANTSIEEIVRRIERYTAMDIYVAWVAVTEPVGEWDEEAAAHVVRVKKWWKYLHGMYGGRMYFWRGGAEIRAYHFVDIERWVESVTVNNGRGGTKTGGGYYRTLKTKKVMMPSPDILHLGVDFLPKRENYHGPVLGETIECRLWKDYLMKWW